jgi:uncharacterized tellurite resistance protein B-like protein
MFGLFKNFVGQGANEQSVGELEAALTPYLEGHTDDEKTIIVCMSGLMARVSYADLDVSAEEKEHMFESLKHHVKLSDDLIKEIVEVTTHTIKRLGRLENHLYVYPLKEVYDRDERYQIVEALFEVAASDGKVDASEVEEIRLVNKGFDLSDKHFLAAKAKVVQHLSALKKTE